MLGKHAKQENQDKRNKKSKKSERHKKNKIHNNNKRNNQDGDEDQDENEDEGADEGEDRGSWFFCFLILRPLGRLVSRFGARFWFLCVGVWYLTFAFSPLDQKKAPAAPQAPPERFFVNEQAVLDTRSILLLAALCLLLAVYC